MNTILLTGATGYIGSHTWLALLAAGYRVVGADHFGNSSPRVLDRLTELSGTALNFERIDVRDSVAVDGLFNTYKPAAVVHFAAWKAVGESVAKPLDYYRNNLDALLTVCEVMRTHDCHRFVFSSSATVYGSPERLPIVESSPLGATNPYGQTKLIGETILNDLASSDSRWRHVCLRYFNPVGAHQSGRIGEDPRGVPNNLMPYVAQVAVGRRPALDVFGNDYDTPDGTGVRDYIHVEDLADGHVAALRYLMGGGDTTTVNLGTGRGFSVLDVVRAYEKASGRKVPYRIAPRRPGDIASCYADATLAGERLQWRAKHDLARMCADSWRWQSANPRGFE